MININNFVNLIFKFFKTLLIIIEEHRKLLYFVKPSNLDK